MYHSELLLAINRSQLWSTKAKDYKDAGCLLRLLNEPMELPKDLLARVSKPTAELLSHGNHAATPSELLDVIVCTTVAFLPGPLHPNCCSSQPGTFVTSLAREVTATPWPLPCFAHFQINKSHRGSRWKECESGSCTLICKGGCEREISGLS